MAPHHHLRASFIANPVLFSFPAAAVAAPIPVRTRDPRAAVKTTLTTAVQESPRPVESGFWRAFKAGTVGARNRERGETYVRHQGRADGSDEAVITKPRKRALVFAGLVSPLALRFETSVLMLE